MPDIQAFRGLRYDLGHVGSLSDVIAPPYDVISPQLQDELYKKHPANVIRLELNREEPGDDEHQNKYARAAKFFRDWQNQGVLIRETQPALYVYHQVFEYRGETFTRRGFMARVKVEPFGTGKIFPHEETLSGPKVDRLLLTRACKANLSQIFGLYPDPDNVAQDAVERATFDQPALECVDHLGVNPSHVAGLGFECDQDRERPRRRQADFHRRRPPSLRNGHQLPQRNSPPPRAGRSRPTIRRITS